MTETMTVLKAPFPYFGGKSRAASFIWERFGDVPNYVEPFAGSLSVLLSRPHAPRIETVNDADAYLSNFWRAVQHDPENVARWADWPVNEVDLESRHLWLVNEGADRVARLKTDPDYFDAKVAGWWVWGLCSWIGSGWCVQRPHLTGAGRGIHRSLPHLTGAGREYDHLLDYFGALSDRLRRVRVCCGDWTRVLTPSVTCKHGMTGVLLDPPYAQSERTREIYAVETDVSAAVCEWAVVNGENPELRIALCGYEGEREMPSAWECVAWKAHGGYGGGRGNQADANSYRERVWFSPHCLKPEKVRTLFDWAAEEAAR